MSMVLMANDYALTPVLRFRAILLGCRLMPTDFMNRVEWWGCTRTTKCCNCRQRTLHESRTSLVWHSTVVVGAEYGFFENKLGVGVLSTTRFVQPKTLTEVTFSANYRPKSWLERCAQLLG